MGSNMWDTEDQWITGKWSHQTQRAFFLAEELRGGWACSIFHPCCSKHSHTITVSLAPTSQYWGYLTAAVFWTASKHCIIYDCKWVHTSNWGSRSHLRWYLTLSQKILEMAFMSWDRRWTSPQICCASCRFPYDQINICANWLLN